MDYRQFSRSEQKISTIGIGGSKLHLMSDEEAVKTMDLALERGVNILDLATELPSVFPKMRQALKGRRDKIMTALHLGLTFQDDGQYKRTRNLAEVKAGFERQLNELATDYADIGYIHYVDERDDFRQVFSGGTFDYAVRLKKEGRIRKLGFASHRADICQKFLETGVFDLFMFSLNPAYDIDPVKHNPLEEDLSSLKAVNVARERIELYRTAERMGVDIIVMKPLGGGRLLDAGTSPFERALTVPQCLQYCLDRPAVVSCMVGVGSAEELKGILEYYDSGLDERDYSFIAGMHYKEMLGQCVYCNHCRPCPSNIDIALVHKFLDLAQIGDELARQHYLTLQNKAGDCVECGSCEDNCPFQVPILEKMKTARDFFGA